MKHVTTRNDYEQPTPRADHRRRRRALGVGAAALAVWLGGGAAFGQAAPTERARRHEEARAVLLARCDGCHQSSSQAANSAALGAFDLDRPGWADRLATRQLRQLPERVRRPAFHASEADRQRVDAFVVAELAARGERPSVKP
jgi:mono/diheme cytochrome c family protein